MDGWSVALILYMLPVLRALIDSDFPKKIDIATQDMPWIPPSLLSLLVATTTMLWPIAISLVITKAVVVSFRKSSK